MLPRYPVRRVAHQPIVARDGCVLSAALYLPDAPGDGPFAVALDAVPYRKDDDFLSNDWDTYGYLASRGVATVRLDLRGTGSSDGIIDDEYTETEFADIEETIVQVAAMDWSCGRVGMTGVSWGGFNAVQVAMRRPEALAAIVPVHWSSDRFNNDVHYVGGTMQLRDSVDWQNEMVAENALPPHPGIVGSEEFERMWRQRVDRTPQWPLNWVRRQRRDAYWKHGSLCEDWTAINCPVLAVGGWLDGYQVSCLDLLEHGRMPRRAILGPWAHSRPHKAWPGPAFDYRIEIARWFRRFLLGECNGVDTEPLLMAYELDGMPREPYPEGAVAGRWRAFTTWPPSTADQLALGDDEGLGGAAMSRPRSWNGPWSVGARMPWWGAGGPPLAYGLDMRPDDAMSICFTTAPLSEAVEILGSPGVRLTVSADRAVALVAVRLEHVAPDGDSRVITRHHLNLTHRESQEFPTAVVPGELMDVAFRLPPTGVVVAAGDRIRVAIAGADFPIAMPPPEPVTITVHRGSILLPTPDAAAEMPPVDLPSVDVEGPGTPVVYGDAAVPDTWTGSFDAMSRTTSVCSSGGWHADLPDGGLTAGTGVVTASIRDDDPASARAEARHTATVRHDGVTARSEARLALSCTATSFVVEIDLTVTRDGAPYFERSWRDEVPRDLM